LIFHLALIAFWSSLALWGLERASQAQAGWNFLGFAGLALIALGVIPWLLYHSYALWVARYTLERGGIRLQWGLRVEDIPMHAVLNVIPATTEAGLKPPLPWLSLPGAVLGTRRLSDGRKIEYLAERTQPLLYVATQEQVYAISPCQIAEFVQTYRSFTELGAFSYLPQRSSHAAELFANFWENLPARLLILAGAGLGLVLLAWVSLEIPGRPGIPFRFNADGQAVEYAPAVRLFLLPILNGLIFGFNLLLGLFFYRRADGQLAAYLLWIASIVTALLFLGAATQIL
jgi:hypothetical protein